MKKKKQLLIDFFGYLQDQDSMLCSPDWETVVIDFWNDRKKKNKIATKLKIQDLERQIAGQVNKNWRQGATAKILKNESNHGFKLGDEVIVLHPDSFQGVYGWQCYSELSGSVYWIMECEAEVVG